MSPPTISREDLFEFETFLFDADGTLWTSDLPIDGAVDFVSSLQNAGKRVFIILFSFGSQAVFASYIQRQHHAMNVKPYMVLSNCSEWQN
ncbi:hypothetical protein TELCIR_08647 [Teladorsagia circumcincta]|uniref:Uncharacterized protein n=1 Tax=Teladorsagia circumcincta TaxID=45464 RepID=A0A2G9UH03_TELCI|nr:hypothetical protein TELCIR_08647 [Teladorsagia circumcincta]